MALDKQAAKRDSKDLADNQVARRDSKYLWNGNPRLRWAKQVYDSSDNWLNGVEIEFVKSSINREIHNTRLRWFFVCIFIGGLSLGLWFSLRGQARALKNQALASRQASEASLQSNQDLEAMLASLKAEKLIQDWPWYLFLFKPDRVLHKQVEGTLHEVVYGARERNKLEQPEVQDRVTGLAVSQDGKTITGFYNNGVAEEGLTCAWSISGQLENCSESTKSGTQAEFAASDVEKHGYISNVAQSKTAIFKPYGTLKVGDTFDLIEGKSPPINIKTHHDQLESWVFSPVSQKLITGGRDGVIRIWDLNAKFEKTEPSAASNPDDKPCSGGNLYNSRLSPDGKLCATWAKAENDYVVHLQGSSKALELRGHTQPINDVTFSKNGKFLATGATDGTARLWKTDGTSWKVNGRESQSIMFRGHANGAIKVRFSDNGELLATAGVDGIAKVWDVNSITQVGNVNSQQPIAEFAGKVRQTSEMQFSHDGANLTTNNGSWPIETADQLRSRACGWVKDYLANNPNVSDKDRHLCDGVAAIEPLEQRPVAPPPAQSPAPVILELKCDAEEKALIQAGGKDFGVIPKGGGKIYKSDYSGKIVNGKRNGCGVYVFPNGDRYIGEFVNDQFEGQGKYIWNENKLYKTYEGGFSRSKYDGLGKLSWADGSGYTGEFSEGQCQGKGTYTDGNGKVVSGIWEKGNLQGADLSCNRH